MNTLYKWIRPLRLAASHIMLLLLVAIVVIFAFKSDFKFQTSFTFGIIIEPIKTEEIPPIKA
jgi:uncharacterized membrane protein